MQFNGISRVFKLTNEQQYETIGRFWDEMALIYGLENLRGLGYKWENDERSSKRAPFSVAKMNEL